ncbi:MAG: hypothetical protein P9E24_02700 [Candidatus Competibacter sp.]|nr:hypothetical protein [Candidatus Competibacter sp.]MDG4582954.1 hypothetical protein [Candidatus Competibacter sp.]
MNVYYPPLSDRLAAEYVLGTLHGLARRRFERLLPAHPALQRAVADWERRLNRLVAASAPVPPPPVWQRLERRLFPTEPRRRWWDSLAFWRGLAVAGVLAAVVAVAPRLALPPGEADMNFAAIRGKQREVLWTVALTDGNRLLHVSNLRPMTMPPDQRCFLWLKTGDRPPLMLGALPDDGSARTLNMPADMPRPNQGDLWVSMQPASDPAPPAHPLYETRWQAL